MITFENKNATPAEKELFRYGGFYKILENENCTKYVPVYTDKVEEFPEKIEVEKDHLEQGTEIVFYHMAETVKCIGMFDKRLINLIQTRIVELGWSN